MTKRQNFLDKFKAAVAIEMLPGNKIVQEIATKQQLHPTQVSTWKRQAIEGVANVFSDKVKKAESKELHAKINQLAVKMFFVINAKAMSPSERHEIIRKKNNDLSLTHQFKLLKISRSSIYYTPVGIDPTTIDLMHKIDRILRSIRFLAAVR